MQQITLATYHSHLLSFKKLPTVYFTQEMSVGSHPEFMTEMTIR